MKYRVVLAIISSVFSLSLAAQIRGYRAIPSPELYPPSGIKTPVSFTGFASSVPYLKSSYLQYVVRRPLPVNAAAQHLPFFCRQELKAEKRTGIPLRLRLGSIQYTDWLEQKPGAAAPR